MGDSPIERVRALCLRLPEVEERLSHGEPTWFVRGKKVFVMFADDHHDDGRLAIWCNAAPGAQQALVRANAGQYFVPAYVGPRGWVGVRLDRDPDWDEVADLIEDAYRVTAPPRRVARLGMLE